MTPQGKQSSNEHTKYAADVELGVLAGLRTVVRHRLAVSLVCRSHLLDSSH